MFTPRLTAFTHHFDQVFYGLPILRIRYIFCDCRSGSERFVSGVLGHCGALECFVSGVCVGGAWSPDAEGDSSLTFSLPHALWIAFRAGFQY